MLIECIGCCLDVSHTPRTRSARPGSRRPVRSEGFGYWYRVFPAGIVERTPGRSERLRAELKNPVLKTAAARAISATWRLDRDLHEMTASQPQRPSVSVIVEGYNETQDLGEAVNTVEALREQDYPVDQVEIVLLGSAEQVDRWKERYADDATFWGIRPVVVEGLPYLQVKNHGAQFASGEILAFTDSDVFPHRRWLTSLVEGLRDGDVSVGLSLFKDSSSWRWNRPTRLIAASITWGWIVGNQFDSKRGVFSPVGFMDHNFGMRAETFRSFHYGSEYGRLCGAPILAQALLDGGQTLVLQPLQRVTHYFAWAYWLKCLHFRYGYEVYVLRRKLHGYPNKWIAKTRVLEPLVTLVWHVALDIPRWFRVSRMLDVSPFRRLAFLPVVFAMSCVARTAEMVGMYCTMLDADRMEKWAETV